MMPRSAPGDIMERVVWLLLWCVRFFLPVSSIDVLVGLVAGIQSGKFAGDFKGRREFAQSEDGAYLGPCDLLEPVDIEDNGLFILINLNNACPSVECHER